MTCRDIMTASPACCLPSDSVAIAARIMKQDDVGPVLIVSDQNEKRLIGIVTDRDLTVKVLADGRDPHTTRVDEVMTMNPVSVQENSSTNDAMRLMAANQVRRIPVVDEANRLHGIVAQADIARHESGRKVGEVVEQISNPAPSYGSRDPLSAWPDRSLLAAGALCLGIGAGLMYVFDPTRRSTQRYQTAGQNPDDQLVSRIRSKIGRAISHARAVQVTSNNGAVTLSGPVLADEVRNLIDCVNSIDGVRTVESRLEVHDSPETHPSLQGRSWPALRR